jgi:hypothetical protein
LIDSISSSFLVEHTSLSLPELRWAFDNGIIGAQVVVNIVRAMKGAGDDDTIVRRLAVVTHGDLQDVRDIISSVELDDETVERSRHKWVWLVLSWVYERHRDDADVFEKLDGLYADLGYPEEMEAFGPYAPAYQTKGDPTDQRRQVVEEWRRFLSRGEESFGSGGPSATGGAATDQGTREA